jgi:predicted membrane-bound spermidine synthase
MSSEPAATPDDPRHTDETYRLSAPNPMFGDDESSPTHVPPPVERAAPRKAARKSHAVSEFWAMCGYNSLVFITSVCVMTLELTASRLIAKTVGSSLYTWTSVIGVVLAGITLGNFLGGWLADRFDRGRSLAWMYLLASISCASVLWLDHLISPMSRPSMLSWPAWILTVVSAMFLLPSLALGTISPLVASMALSRCSRMGSTVGNVYAWGALGSIIGTFLTGFYLMDVWGTRTIVGLTAGTLGLLAVIVAGAPRLFRVAVVCGWLQLLGWTVLAATCTERAMAAIASSVGSIASVSQSAEQAEFTRTKWSRFGISLGTKLHELGLLLKLRDDNIGAYYDESSYSTIMVTEGEDGDRLIKNLRLDKLIHSYYDPNDPTRLKYEYEQVYAAVTKRTASLLTQPVTLSTRSLPADTLDARDLPAGVSFDAASATLKVEQPSREVFQALLNLAPESGFWKAVEELYRETNKPLWGGFSSVELEELPEGVSIPESLAATIRHDRSLEVVTAYGVVTAELRDRLIRGTPSGAWYSEVERARGESRRASALFMGGGGFIFPRWFLKEFPGSERIEVAELDPAVYRVAIEALRLTETEQKRIQTTIGDARNFVDDRLRDNRRLVAAGKSPVRYDFIYGDAFNDFSIPAHLTTREFLQKLHDLLSDDGVFQANIIDIYPHWEFPGTTVGEGEVDYQDRLPKELAAMSLTFGLYAPAPKRFEPLEIKSYKDTTYRLRATRTLMQADVTRLSSLNGTRDELTDTQLAHWSSAVEQLAVQTRKQKAFAGVIPAKLQASGGPLDAWTPAASPLECIEVCRIDADPHASGVRETDSDELQKRSIVPGGDRYVLGVRGIVSDELQKKLIQVDSGNTAWTEAVQSMSRRSRAPGPGRFLGRYVATAARVFPNIYLYSTSSTQPSAERDTFVMVCSRRPLDLKDLADTGDWTGGWFAALEARPGNSEPTPLGQMSAVLTLSEGQLLTDDFAPVDNLLEPVFADQE